MKASIAPAQTDPHERIVKAAVTAVYDHYCSGSIAELESAVVALIGQPIRDEGEEDADVVLDMESSIGARGRDPILDRGSGTEAIRRQRRADTLLTPSPQTREAVEPEQKPVAWLCEDLIMPQNNSVTLDREFAMSRAKYGDAWKVTPLYASPVRSAQEAVSDLDIQIAYEAWIDRTIGARAPITAFYAGYRAALLPPGGETATPDSEHRRTFTVPHGYEPVFDDTGRATGEIRPALSEKQQ